MSVVPEKILINLYILNINAAIDIGILIKSDSALKIKKGGMIMTAAEKLIEKARREGIEKGIERQFKKC